MDAAALPRADATRIAVIGLGYVGLPLAVGFGRKLPTLGFDINRARIDELRGFRDHTLECSPEELKATPQLSFSADAADLNRCNVFIVTVPTPIDEREATRPDPARIGQPHGRQRDRARRRGDLRIDRVSRARPKRSACRSSSASRA